MPQKSLWQNKSSQLFDNLREKVFTKKDLAEILELNRSLIDAPRTLSVSRFIQVLTDGGQLRKVPIHPALPEKKSDSPIYKSFTRYIWGRASAFEVALSLRKGSYLTHASAVFLHGLTDQIPKTVYANKEQTPKQTNGHLTQAAIDRAFANKPRMSKYIFMYDESRLVLLSGKNTGRAEVIPMLDQQGAHVEVTGLERTLIDIVVRPIYSGGVFEVLNAFRAAKERVSIGTLIAVLRKMEFVYPYHQAIGFYMEKAGYEPRLLKRVQDLGINYDFYIANQLPDKEYSPKWRLYYPKGL